MKIARRLLPTFHVPAQQVQPAYEPPSPPVYYPGSLGLKLSPGCECCPDICLIYGDGFARSDTIGSVGSNYTPDVETNWRINNNRLICTGSDSALIYNRDQPDSFKAQKVRTYVQSSTSGNQLRHIVGYADSGNYLYSEVEFTNGTYGTLELYKNLSGSPSQLGETCYIYNLNLGTKYVLETCLSPSGYFQASIDSDLLTDPPNWGVKALTKIHTVDLNNYGLKIGLATGNIDGSGIFDKLRYNRHKSHIDSTTVFPYYCHTCRIDCNMWHDDFVRHPTVSSGTLGEFWDVRSGNWTIDKDENATVDITTPPTLQNPYFMICKNEHQNSRFNQVMHGEFNKAISGMIIVDYIDDDNYHFVAGYNRYYAQDENSNASISYYKRHAGTVTKLEGPYNIYSWTDAAGNPYIRYVGGNFFAAIANNRLFGGEAEMRSFADTVAHSGTKCGIGICGVLPDASGYFVRTRLEEYGGDSYDSGYHNPATLRQIDNYGDILNMNDCSDSTPCGLSCEDTLPQDIQVTIAGIVNDVCSNCNDYNGTFVLPFARGFSGITGHYQGECVWVLCDINDPCDSTYCIALYLRPPGFHGVNPSGQIRINIDVASFIKWYDPDLFPMACDDFSSENIPLSTSSAGDCDATSATATITSL